MHKKILEVLIFILIILFIAITKSSATETNYKVIIEDDADLLTATEEAELKKQMTVLTEFGNVLFKTTSGSTSYSKSLKYIQDYYYSILQNKPGVAFYIDMHARQVCACATGGLDKIITNGKCDSIMDNIYKYASKEQYFKCAEETFSQMNILLNGGKIAESMKYICNAFVAVMISFFASYGFFSLFRGNKKASNQDLIDECDVTLNTTPIIVTKTGQHSVYSPPSSSSGGSSGGGGGGGRWTEVDFLEAVEAMDSKK